MGNSRPCFRCYRERTGGRERGRGLVRQNCWCLLRGVLGSWEGERGLGCERGGLDRVGKEVDTVERGLDALTFGLGVKGSHRIKGASDRLFG